MLVLVYKPKEEKEIARVKEVPPIMQESLLLELGNEIMQGPRFPAQRNQASDSDTDRSQEICSIRGGTYNGNSLRRVATKELERAREQKKGRMLQ